jgi:cytochrome c biogenesis protein CcmG, thiol:disulfide interchange protein DsbE
MATKVETTKTPGLALSWLGLIAIVLVLGGGWILSSRVLLDAGPLAGGLEPAPAVGHPAPDFTLRTVDGQELSLSDFRGRPVVVNFWATWCPPCRAEMPDFQAAFIEYQNEGLVIIGVNSTAQDDPDLVPGFVAEFGLTFPIVLDETGEVTSAYKILGLPTSIFVDKNGVVQEVFTGPTNKAYIAAKLPDLL